MKRPVPLVVVDHPKPVRIAVTPARALRNYPDSMSLQHKWQEACLWMQTRPGGSIWLLDAEARIPKWRVPE